MGFRRVPATEPLDVQRIAILIREYRQMIRSAQAEIRATEDLISRYATAIQDLSRSRNGINPAPGTVIAFPIRYTPPPSDTEI